MEFSTCRRAGPDPLQARVRVTRREAPCGGGSAAAAEQLLALPANAPQLAEAIALLGQAKQDKKADEIVGRLLVRFPAEQETLAAARQLGPKAVQAHLATIEQRMQRLRRLTRANANRAAADEADALLKDLPDDHALRCELLYLQGRTARKRRRYQQALTVLAARARNACLKERNFLMRSVLLTVQVQAIRGHLRGMRRNVDWMAKYHPKHRFTDMRAFCMPTRSTGEPKDGRCEAVRHRGPECRTPTRRSPPRGVSRGARSAASERRKQSNGSRVFWNVGAAGDRTPARAVLAGAHRGTAGARPGGPELQEAARTSVVYAWMALERLRDIRPRTAKAVEAQLVQVATATTTLRSRRAS